jgi:putative membrane protein
MADYYLWIRAFHIIAVIAWMAGLLYLPRLFVYHCEAEAGSKRSEMLKIMERRLLRAIMTPAMIVAFVLGAALIAIVGFEGGWLHAKLALVLILAVNHGLMARWRRDFAEDRNRRSRRFYRIANEVPAALMAAIVILAVVKPF